MNYHGSEISVEESRAERVLEAADYDRLIDEGVERPTQAPPFGCESRPPCRRRSRDDEDLKVRPTVVGATKRGRQHIRRNAFAILVGRPVPWVVPERLGEKSPGYPASQGSGGLRIIVSRIVA